MQKRILQYIEKHHMVAPGDRVAAGVSGGADSVCLLLALQELRSRIPFELAAVHVNHGLRGEEAGEDAAFVEALCRRQGICFQLYSCPVRREAEERKIGLEEAGREARRRSFEDFLRRWGGTKIALAHHKNDVAETMLHNLARGTGLAGLCSLAPVRGQYIRPLLCVGRQEIEEYLRGKGQEWREDSSNKSLEFSRNVIRHQVLEPLQSRVNSRAAEHMAAAAELLGEAEAYLRQQAGLLEERYVRKEGDFWLVDQAIRKCPKILKNYVLASCAEQARGSRRDLGQVHVEALADLLEGQVGRQVNLPGGVTAVREYGGLSIGRAGAVWKPPDGACEKKAVRIQGDAPAEGLPGEKAGRIPGGAPGGVAVQVPGEITLGEWTVRAELEKKELAEIPQKTYTKWLDYDKIKDTAVWRTRRPGDRMQVTREGGSKKLKDLMIDWKIPRALRDEIWLLAAGQRVLWVPGYRLAESCKISPETKRMVKITVQGGSIHE